VDAGGIDVEVAPGMTVPTDLFTCLAIRSHDPIENIVAEHPGQTKIESLGEREGRSLYRVKFARLGENLLTVNHGAGRSTRLEFFASEPLETLIHKRAAFIAKHRVRDADKWYNGLLAEWNMDSQVQLGPDNYDRIKGWRIYEVTCDDPGLSKPAYLASKNAEFPNPDEVEALDYYIEHLVGGGLQRTTEETDSYGIYGIPDWKQNRDSSDPGNKGQRHIWRCYDYPHIIVMYFSMYRIARDYPGMKMKLDRAAYLERAYGTALGMFTIPMGVTGWSAYETGFYNEVVIPQLIEELDQVGKHAEAAQLRTHWEKKVTFFVSGTPNLFGSEYAFDSTGFESTQAIARYALDRPMTQGITAEAATKFAATQVRANLSLPWHHRESILLLRQRLSRRCRRRLHSLVYVADGRMGCAESCAVRSPGARRYDSPRIRIVSQRVVPDEYRHARVRLRLLVSGRGQRWRHRRRIRAGCLWHDLARPAPPPRPLVLLLGNGHGLLLSAQDRCDHRCGRSCLWALLLWWADAGRKCILTHRPTRRGAAAFLPACSRAEHRS
jgi:hypothetical protein